MLLRGPRRLGGWRVRLGRALMLLFPGWNGSSLWLFGRARDRAAAGAGNARGDRRAAVPSLPQPPCTSACLRSASGWRVRAQRFWRFIPFPAVVLLVLRARSAPSSGSRTTAIQATWWLFVAVRRSAS